MIALVVYRTVQWHSCWHKNHTEDTQCNKCGFMPIGDCHLKKHDWSDHIGVTHIGLFMYASAEQACFTEFLGAQESK